MRTELKRKAARRRKLPDPQIFSGGGRDDAGRELDSLTSTESILSSDPWFFSLFLLFLLLIGVPLENPMVAAVSSL